MQVKEVYDKIAEDWSNKRQWPHPPEILEIKHWKGRILELGCGNCANLTLFKDSELYGIDFSEKMIEQAKKFCEKHNMKVDLKVGDVKHTPYKDKFFDYIIFSRVFAHLRKEEQLESLKELKRILKGKCFLAVWNKNAEENIDRPKEALVPWTYKEKTYQRYYYLFDEQELIDLVEKAGFKVEKILSKKDSKNICLKC